MTLILTIQTRGSIWVVADRRLSSPNRRPIEDAIKVTLVTATDGIAILAYAGLGATALGSQPSQWVSSVLRGRRDPLEQMLEIVASAMKREFAPHLDGVHDSTLRQHRFIIPAFLKNRPKIYTIDMAHSNEGYRSSYTRHIMGGALTPLQVTVPIGLAGSGVAALLPIGRWSRALLNLIKAYNRGKISGQAVAKHLAQIAYSSHLNTKDGSVGPDCIVVWRNPTESPDRGGGSQAFFSHGKQASASLILPSISNGMDMSAMVQILLQELTPHLKETLGAVKSDREPPAVDAPLSRMNHRLSLLPKKSDERLR